MQGCEDKVAGLIQPAVDDIVELCIKTGLAAKKGLWAGIAAFTQRTVQEWALTRSMHRAWL